MSEALVKESSYHWLTKPTLNQFIPLETQSGDDWRHVEWKEKLVVGHSVGFDRSFVKEQYLIKVGAYRTGGEGGGRGGEGGEGGGEGGGREFLCKTMLHL